MARKRVERGEDEELTNVGFVVPSSFAAVIKERSAELGLSKSELMRRALEHYLSEVAA